MNKVKEDALMAFRPHRFGRYIIVDPIAVGGMAEIYRARLAASKEGPDRVIVIKKVIANLSQNQEFVQMFEEEIKITVGLTHPNIIQIYDYGKHDDQLFMAMEYVEGKNLRQFVKRLADMKSMFSIDMSCYIISQVCHSLAYAHAYKDRMSGKPLGIVHRDISPQNVMISYDGAVKLFDFGIAKAKSASEATRAGVIKGKPSYLSPEQINGEELDGRCDIFALGIVLWELLTAKRLFVADTDMGVLRLIQSAKIEPPSTFNPAVPQALDAIVLKSLTRDKAKRYQTAEEFQRDLHKFLYSFNPSFNPADLSYYAQELFKIEIRDDRERLSKYLAMEPIDDGKADEPSTGTGSKKKEPLSNKLAEGLVSSTDFNREMMELVHKESTGSISNLPSLELASTNAMPKPKSVTAGGKPPVPGAPPLPGGAPPVPGAAPTMPNVASGPAAARSSGSPAAMKKMGNDSMVIPPWSKQSVGSNGLPRGGSKTTAALRRELDSQSSNSSRNMMALLLVLFVGGVFAARQYCMLENTPLEFLSAGSCGKGGRNIASPDEPRVETVPNIPNQTIPEPTPVVTPLKANQGLVVLQSDIGNFQVTVNGQGVALSNNQFPAPLNTDLNIEVTKVGFEPVRFRTKLTSQAPAAYRIEFKKAPSGTLFFMTTPNAKLIFYNGDQRMFELQSPVKNHPMPVGEFRVVVENDLIGYKGEVKIVLEEGKVTRVEKILK